MARKDSTGSRHPSGRATWWHVAVVCLLGLVSVLVALAGQPTARAWSGQPTVNTPICTALEDQLWNNLATTIVSRPNIVSDGSGGAIIVWYDNRTAAANGYDIYAQRLDTSGTPVWGENGRAIYAGLRYQQSPTIVSDGSGGAVIAWEDYRTSPSSGADVYAQRIDASGTLQWGEAGRAICTSGGDQRYPTLVSDGSGGAIIAWQDRRNGPNYDIYAQMVNASGTPLWNANGVAICTAAGDQTRQTMVADGAGGAIVTWQDLRNGSTADIYAEKVDSSGNMPWPTGDGVAICTYTDDQMFPTIASDGSGGAIIAWQDRRGGTYSDIYAQRVDLNGAVPAGWPADGAAICAVDRNQNYPAIVADGSGGAIMAWEEYRTSGYRDIYAEKVDASGNTTWPTPDGTIICTAAWDQRHPTLVSDGAGGAIIAWQDSRTPATGIDIYALRVDSSGSRVAGWAEDGVAISTATSTQQNPVLIGDGSGGAIIAWRDNRNSGTSRWDLYGQKVEDDGSLPPAPVVASVDPTLGDQSQSMTGLTITGENFTGTTSVSFGADVTVDDFTVISDTIIEADITIGPSAALGTRDVVVTSPEGTGTLSACFTVNPALLPDFHADRVEVVAGQDVQFSDDSGGGSGSFSYDWDFGDTGTSTLQNPSHSFSAAGTYTVSLTVTDSADNSVTKTKGDYVSVVGPPDADFSADPTALLAGQSVTFTDLSSGGVGSISWDWDFGDGGASTLQNPSHTFGAAGTYTVALTVTDAATNVDTETKSGYITVAASPIADFVAGDTVAMAGEDIAFTNLSSGGISPRSYEWDFDNDGTWDSTADEETYAYSSPGTYTVVLRLTDAAANTDSETKVDYITIVESCGSASSAAGTGTVEVCTSAGVLEDLSGVTEDSLPQYGKPNLIFGHGLLEFRTTGLTPGQTVTLVITLPSPTPESTQYWKYGPTADNPAGAWYSIPLGSNDGDNVIVITLRDGGPGDDDLTANGTIVDQGGPGTPRPPEPAPAFPSAWAGMAAALGIAVLAYLIHMRLASR